MKMTSNSNNIHILGANNKIVRHDGKVFRIYASTLGRTLLASFEGLNDTNKPTGVVNDLFGKTKLAKSIRALVEKGLVS